MAGTAYSDHLTWRYARQTKSATAHALDYDNDGISLCGYRPPRWYGVGTPEEVERVACMRKCAACRTVVAVVQGNIERLAET